jgi:DNA-binding CsgD family transcriptional regulator
MKVAEFHSRLKQINSLNGLQQALSEYLVSFGIDHFAITCYGKPNNTDKTGIHYSFMSDKYRIWHEHYHAQQYDRIDTTTHTTKKTDLPTIWEIKQQIKQAKSKREKVMREDSQRFGLVRGASIPINHPNGEQSILMLAETKGQNCLNMWDAIQYEIFSAAYYYDSYLRNRLFKELLPGAQQYQLSPRQLQCLKLIAESRSVTDMAKIMLITERTVNFHIQKMNKSLGTGNKYISVAKAKECGILT